MVTATVLRQDYTPAVPVASESLEGRVVSFHSFVGDSSRNFFYLGLLGDAYETDEVWDEYELPAVRTWEVLSEDTETFGVSHAELDANLLQGSGTVLAPVGPSGGLLVAWRRRQATRAKCVRGVVAGCQLDGQGRMQVKVVTARYSWSEPNNNTEGRHYSSSLASSWTFAELNPDTWRDDDCDLPDQFESLWAWLHSHPEPPGGAGRVTGSSRSGGTPAAAGDGPPRQAATRDVGAVSDNVMSLLEHMPEVHRYAAGPRGVEDRTLQGLAASLAGRRRAAVAAYKPRRRFPRNVTPEEAREIDAIVDVLAMPRVSTMRNLRSKVEGYRQACATFPNSDGSVGIPMFPVTARAIGRWAVRAWLAKKPHRVKMRNFDAYLNAVRQFAAAQGHDIDERPPGMNYFEFKLAKQSIKTLRDVEDEGVERAFPMVLELQRMLLPFVDLSDDQQLQHWARSLLAHFCCCRGEDHSRGKPRWGDFKERYDEAPGRATWIVRAGKCHPRSAAEVAEHIPDYDEWPDALQCGFVMQLYRQRMRARFDISDDAPLFPRLPDAGGARIALGATSPAASDKGFMGFIHGLCRRVPLPDFVLQKITMHSWRSGGASDYFNYGADQPNIVQFIMRQGRWRSACFQIYIRLRSTQVARVLGSVLAKASHSLAIGADGDPGRAVQILETIRQATVNPTSFRTAPPLFAYTTRVPARRRR